MTIHEPLGFTRPVDPSKGNRTQTADRSGVAAGHEGRDHLAVSDRALALYETEKAHRLDEIRMRLRQGYYLDRRVTEDIVDVLVQEIHLAETAEH
jgi:hypothetical protein